MRLFLGGIAAFVLGGVFLLLWYGYSYSCPCGFEFDPTTGGCRVILGSVDCGSPQTGRPPAPGGSGGTPGAPASPGALAPGGTGNFCPWLVQECKVQADKKSVSFVAVNPWTISTTPVKVHVHIRQTGCASIIGFVMAPTVRDPLVIPFDPGILAGTFVSPPHGLLGTFQQPCQPGLTEMVAFPDFVPIGRAQPEDCGCRVTRP